MTNVYTDEFRICCILRDTVGRCSAIDLFSSCEDLLRKDLLGALMLIIGTAALIGNLVVIISRKIKNEHTVQSILITNLAVSDLLMAVYMFIIVGADVYYRGRYAEFSTKWKASWLCSFAGVVSTVSSECSVFILMIVSFDRALNIAFPFNTKKLNTKSCKIIMVIVWLVIIVASLLPLFTYHQYDRSYNFADRNNMTERVLQIDLDLFNNDYYGSQSVCLALPLSRNRKPGWEIAIVIFIAFNFFSFIVIAVSYVTIFISIKRSAATANRSARRAEDIRIAVKLALIVLTDFFCWFPVILMGIASEAGDWKLPDEIYVWSAAFIIPINSSINPYLFTIAYMCACNKKDKPTNANQMQAVVAQPVNVPSGVSTGGNG